MASMKDPEPVKPPCPRLPVEEVERLSVFHPKYERQILHFGCRTERGTSRAMSRLLVQQAGAIVAQTEGFLSLLQDRAETERIVSETDVLIPAGKYYFHATDPACADYGICGDFDAWEPPAGPDQLPEPWRTLAKVFNEQAIPEPDCTSSGTIDWSKKADGYCILTGNPDLIECQHAVPQEHLTWADIYDIVERGTKSGYSLPASVNRVIDDIRCLLTMNPYTHDLMDSGLFVPFPVTTADGSTVFVAYFASQTATASGLDHHCRALNIPARISPYILYIRFAWTIFKFMVVRTTGPIPRKSIPEWYSKKRKHGDSGGSGCGSSGHGSFGGGSSGSGDGASGSGAGSHGASGRSRHKANVPSMVFDMLGTHRSADELEVCERLLPPGVLEIFSDVDAGKIEPPAFLYEHAMVYPGMTRIACLREEYMKQHPQVSSTGDQSTLRLL
ncbi:hypothetical protein BDZ89DRAFT_1067196 [Hymenopellis radicata]|nr:hypothetical protein BDZ89DRAFT_1067196 [Hymenopellis radicata]